MEEATEHLVKLYLEAKGYLVTSNKKVKIPQTIQTKRGLQEQLTAFEVDIVGIHPRTGDRVVADVKSYFGSQGLGPRHFIELIGQPSRDQKRMRMYNDEEFAKQLFANLEEEYGAGFRIELYIGKIKKGDEQKVLDYLGTHRVAGREVKVVRFEQVMRDLLAYVRRQGTTYFNDQVIQTVKVLDAVGLLVSDTAA